MSPKIFFLGCSPDGKVVDSVSRDQFGLAEVKCPSSKFNVTPEEACSDPSFCLELVNGSPRLKRNHEYYDQIQGQMALTGAKWCDFVVYSSRGLNIERIPFDKERWSYVLAILHRTYFRYFLPAAAKKKFLWTETESRSKKRKKRTRPIPRHLDRTSLIHKRVTI